MVSIIETSQIICRANQFTGFYMMGTLAFNELKLSAKFRFDCKFYLLWCGIVLLFVTPSFNQPPIVYSLQFAHVQQSPIFLIIQEIIIV